MFLFQNNCVMMLGPGQKRLRTHNLGYCVTPQKMQKMKLCNQEQGMVEYETKAAVLTTHLIFTLCQSTWYCALTLYINCLAIWNQILAIVHVKYAT
jgi:uncharacterized membrane protein YagU involved in acid resistance